MLVFLKITLPALILASLMAAPAYADGNYAVTMSVPVGQAPQCGNTQQSIQINVAGNSVTADTDRGKCVGQLNTDGTFNCSFHPTTFGVATYSGRVSGSNIDGTYQLSVAPPPPAQGAGFSCHATFKGTTAVR